MTDLNEYWCEASRLPGFRPVFQGNGMYRRLANSSRLLFAGTCQLKSILTPSDLHLGNGWAARGMLTWDDGDKGLVVIRDSAGHGE